MAEVAVHLTVATLPGDFMMLEISIPETISVELIEEHNLPDEWNIFPHSVSTQKIGDNFIDSKKVCILKVPSAVVKGDFNYLINPNHKDFKEIKITKSENFPFDKRMFK
jgi:RES domain-containing protein